jgi:hypothetical protein
VADADTESARYREMANEIRGLVPMLNHTEAAMDLRLLAVRYERVAEYLAGGRVAQRDIPRECLQINFPPPAVSGESDR